MIQRRTLVSFLSALIVLIGAACVWGGSTVLGDVVSARLRHALPGTTSIGRVTALPWRVALHDVQWNVGAIPAAPVLQAHRIIMQPSLGAMLVGRLIFSRVSVRGATITIVRAGPHQWNVTTTVPEHTAMPPQTGPILQRFVKLGKLVVRRLDIYNGTVQFEDHAASQPINVRIQGLRLVIRAMPTPQHFWAAHFWAEGKLRVRPDGRESPFRVSGWVDPVTKDLEAKFHLADVELAPLEPYYQGRVTKVRAYEGRLTLQGTASARANDLTIACQATLSNLTQGGISVLGRTIADVGGALNAAQGALDADFLVRGALDDPAHWKYQLGPNQAPLILFFLPFMQREGETTVIKIGHTELDVGSAVQQWLGPNAPVATPPTVNAETPASEAAPQPPAAPAAEPSAPGASPSTGAPATQPPSQETQKPSGASPPAVISGSTPSSTDAAVPPEPSQATR